MGTELSEYLNINLSDAKKLLLLLGWKEAGADYYTLGDMVDVRYPLATVLEFEAQRFKTVADRLKGKVTSVEKILPVMMDVHEVDPPRATSFPIPPFDPEAVSKLQAHIYTTDQEVERVQERIQKLEEWKTNLVNWLKNILEPPGSKDWVRQLRRPAETNEEKK
jgi:hypothetical protein